MAVLLASGNSIRIPTSILQPMRPITATIALEMAETPVYSLHYNALFALAIVLLIFVLVFNLFSRYLKISTRKESMDKRKKENVVFTIFGILTSISLIFVFTLLFYILSKGLKVISLDFIVSYPKNSFTEGGILPSIVGSLYLVLLAVIFAVPVGILGSVYLSEYAKENRFVELIRLSIDTLAGIPSIIFGLFGLAIFSKLFRF